MTFEFVKKEYKHTDCDKLNQELDEYLSDLSFQSEGLTENFMDIVLDHTNQKEKEWIELYDHPLDWLESILIKTKMEVLEQFIDGLENIVYTEKPKRQPNMNAKQSREWLIDNVKPLILKNITKQKDVSLALNLNPQHGLISKRVERGYGINDWKEYVQGVLDNRY